MFVICLCKYLDEFERGNTLLVTLPGDHIPTRLELIRAIQDSLAKLELQDKFSLLYPMAVESTSSITESATNSFLVTFSNNDSKVLLCNFHVLI